MAKFELKDALVYRQRKAQTCWCDSEGYMYTPEGICILSWGGAEIYSAIRFIVNGRYYYCCPQKYYTRVGLARLAHRLLKEATYWPKESKDE